MLKQISAIICTHNGAGNIKKTIESLINQNLDKEKYEIIVVDNNSTDTTKNIIAPFLERKEIKYIFEDKLGLSNARNTGWENAKGNIIAYLDDDAIADHNWLFNILQKFNTYIDVGIVGGKVEPQWPCIPPTWLNPLCLNMLSLLDWYDRDTFLQKDKWLVGTNIAYRKNLLNKFNGFNINLGRKGKSLISCEEIELNDNIYNEGFKILYSPIIHVKHIIPIERMDINWFLNRSYWQGYSEIIIKFDKSINNNIYDGAINKEVTDIYSKIREIYKRRNKKGLREQLYINILLGKLKRLLFLCSNKKSLITIYNKITKDSKYYRIPKIYTEN